MPSQKKDADLALWKNHINRATITDMADKLGRTWTGFDRDGFLQRLVTPGFLQLELKERINTTADCLNEFLPSDYGKSVKMLIKVAPELNGFHNWILTAYIERFGLKHFDESLDALQELTQYGTGEFAIRPFVIADPQRVLKAMHRWAEHPNEHIRRLAAEGSRPRGVWVAYIDAFRKYPAPVVKLLDRMRADDSLYVRKAVANNLNDISRDNPKIALEVAALWKKDKNPDTDWIIKRGLRTLIKQGHPGVFRLLGFTSKPKIEVSLGRRFKKKIGIGDTLELPFQVISRAKSKQKLAVDYRVTYRTKAGKESARVFKLAERTLIPSEMAKMSVKHAFTDNSTRKHHPGRHEVAIQINGQIYETIEIQLDG